MRIKENFYKEIDDIMSRGTRTAEPKQLVEVKPVFTINDKVRENQVENVRLPPGARLATDEECAAFYRTDANFREDLHINGAAWTGKKGLSTIGPKEIKENGTYRDITEDQFYGEFSNKTNTRSWHYSGSGRVAVYDYGLDGGNGRLGVDAVWTEGRARAAYVFDDQAQAGSVAAAPIGDVVAVQRDKFDAGKEAFRKAEPLLKAANYPDLAEAFRAVFGE